MILDADWVSGLLVEQDAPSDMQMYGHVTAVRGTVVDAWFAGGLPPIDAALECELDGEETITAVVHSHLGNSSVRRLRPVAHVGCAEARKCAAMAHHCGFRWATN